MTPTPVTLLGLGSMGRALAAAFVAAGHPTTVWNRTPGRADGLDGVHVAPSPRAAVAASPVVVVCLLDPAAATAVLDAAGDGLRGRTVVDLTNTSPGLARVRAEQLAALGAVHLDGGIMAVPPMIGGPAALVLCSGDRAAFDDHRGLLSALGTCRYLGADPGAAALHDLALLSGMYGVFAGALHAFALVTGDGTTASEFVPALDAWVRDMLGSLPAIAAEIDHGPAGPAASPLAMQEAGFANLRAAAAERGVREDLMAPMGRLLTDAVAAGYGDRDLGALVQLLRTPAGTPAA